MNQQRAIRAVGGGFHRHDKVGDEVPPLLSGTAPAIGQAVEVRLNLLMGLPAAHDPDQEARWLDLKGRVVEVVEPSHVVAEVAPTTSLHPDDFIGEWWVELRHEDGREYPWKLTSLRPTEPHAALPHGFADETGLSFRIAWATSDAEHALGRVAEASGGSDTPLRFLPLSIPAGERATTIWCVALSEESPDSADLELLVRCSDAVIVDSDPSEFVEDVLADIHPQPAIVHWNRGISPNPIVPMQHGLKRLLTELSQMS